MKKIIFVTCVVFINNYLLSQSISSPVLPPSISPYIEYDEARDLIFEQTDSPPDSSESSKLNKLNKCDFFFIFQK